MKILLRHLVLCALPILFAAGAGYGFTTIQGSCGAMVGALFAAKCAGRQREYQARFQLAGAGFAAQDTTKAAPASAPAPAASPSVSVDESVVAKGVVDRVPQDTGSVFPVDVGPLVFWTKVSGATSGGETPIHDVWF